jgi:hypothetical protein
VGKDIWHRIGRALQQINIGDFGDHIARAVHLHPITDANILATPDHLAARVAAKDVLLVVKRGV